MKEGSKIAGKVLFIDDEDNILSSLKRGFLFSDIQVYTANNPNAALKVLAEERIDVVISDYRMPEMDGMQFLKLVKENFPATARIIFSGFIDRSILIRSLTYGWASTFFTKPWDNKALEKKIRRMLTIKQNTSEHVFRIINNAYELPTFSSQLHRISALLSEEQEPDIPGEKRNNKELLNIIEVDPVLTIKILQVVNSVFFGEREIVSVKEALDLLHPSSINEIVVTTKSLQEMKWNSIEKTHLKEIYIHSIILNIYTPEIYRALVGKDTKPYLPSLGIIHDVGKILLVHYFGEQYGKVISYEMTHPFKSFPDCETELGFSETSHKRIGAYFLDLLNIPVSVINIISGQNGIESIGVEEKRWTLILNYLDYFITYTLKHKTVPGREFKQLESLNVSTVYLEKLTQDILRHGELLNGVIH